MTYTKEERKLIVDMSADVRSHLHEQISLLAQMGMNQTGKAKMESGMVLQAVCYACANVIGELTMTGVREEYRDTFIQNFVLRGITAGQEQAQERIEAVKKSIAMQVEKAIQNINNTNIRRSALKY
jgi:hypothetical protein